MNPHIKILSENMLLISLLFLIATVVVSSFEFGRRQRPVCGVVFALNSALCFTWSRWLEHMTGDAIRVDIFVMAIPFLALTAGGFTGVAVRLVQYGLARRSARPTAMHSCDNARID